jgi:hypothetical protein
LGHLLFYHIPEIEKINVFGSLFTFLTKKQMRAMHSGGIPQAAPYILKKALYKYSVFRRINR